MELLVNKKPISHNRSFHIIEVKEYYIKIKYKRETESVTQIRNLKSAISE